MTHEETDTIGEYIAVIGLSGRFPGAKNLDTFWQNLRDGVESVTFFTDEELLEQGANPDSLRQPNYVKAKPFLEDIDRFDAPFFGVSTLEAEMMDPQRRLFLECAWEALETAGYAPENYEGLIGVFAGTTLSSYLLNNIITNQDFLESVGDAQALLLANDKDYIATNISYKLNLRGPAYTIQCACSTALVAVHNACQSLHNYECDMAISTGSPSVVPVPCVST